MMSVVQIRTKPVESRSPCRIEAASSPGVPLASPRVEPVELISPRVEFVQLTSHRVERIQLASPGGKTVNLASPSMEYTVQFESSAETGRDVMPPVEASIPVMSHKGASLQLRPIQRDQQSTQRSGEVVPDPASQAVAAESNQEARFKRIPPRRRRH